jgi:hypothetical protein
MSFSWRQLGALFRKELRDYRFVILTMAFLPLLFVILPTIQLLTLNASASSAKLDAHIGLSLLYMLMIPAMVPSVLAAYCVVGEREQGTLEPVLITPIGREEFLVGRPWRRSSPPSSSPMRSSASSSASRRSSPSPASPRPCSRVPICSSSFCSPRCSPAGRSGPASPSPRGRPTCEPPGNSPCWPAFPHSASSR